MTVLTWGGLYLEAFNQRFLSDQIEKQKNETSLHLESQDGARLSELGG